MPIDTALAGSPSALYGVADWAKKLRDELDACAAAISATADSSYHVWVGESGDAYRDFAEDLMKATLQVEGRAGLIEGRVRAYAQRLQWRLDDMGQHREDAEKGHLSVTGTVIHEPAAVVEPTEPPPLADASDRMSYEVDVAVYNEYLKKVKLYNKLVGKVSSTYQDLDDWIADNLVTMEAEVTSPFSIENFRDILVDFGFDFSKDKFSDRAADLRAKIPALREALARSRSGNPEVRAGSKPPREIALERAGKAGTPAGEAAEAATAAENMAKWLGRAGFVAGLGLAAWDVSAGGSVSSAAVGVVAGIAAGAALGGAIAAATVTAPAWVPVLATAAAAAGVAWAATAAYEAWVPQATREAIDEGVKDVWNGFAEGVEDRWEAIFG